MFFTNGVLHAFVTFQYNCYLSCLGDAHTPDSSIVGDYIFNGPIGTVINQSYVLASPNVPGTFLGQNALQSHKPCS